jgi:hypothetical protein
MKENRREEEEDKREMIPCSVSTSFSTTVEWLLEIVIIY